MAESLANTRKEATRRQRIEAEQRRRDELREGYARLKDVLPVSNQKSSKVSLLERGTPSPLCQSCPSSHLCSYKPHRQLGEDQSPTAGAISVAGSRSLQASCSEREDFAGSYQYAVARSRQHGQPPFVSSSGRFPVLRWPASTRNCRATCCRVKPICFRERLLNRSACDSISSCFISDIGFPSPPRTPTTSLVLAWHCDVHSPTPATLSLLAVSSRLLEERRRVPERVPSHKQNESHRQARSEGITYFSQRI